jgi:hypothetical protein
VAEKVVAAHQKIFRKMDVKWRLVERASKKGGVKRRENIDISFLSSGGGNVAKAARMAWREGGVASRNAALGVAWLAEGARRNVNMSSSAENSAALAKSADKRHQKIMARKSLKISVWLSIINRIGKRWHGMKESYRIENEKPGSI